MGLLDKLERSAPQAVTWTPFDDRWYRLSPDSGETYAGFPIGPDTALKISAVFACNTLIAETLASLPCYLYRRTDDKGSKERARDHRWYKALRRQPNRRDTPMNFIGDSQMRLGMRGGALAEIVDDGDVGELLPLHPDYTTVELTDLGMFRYKVRDPYNPSAEPRTLLQNKVLNVRDLSTDAFRGIQRVQLAREAIAVAAAAEGYVGRFFKYDATGRLVITHPTALNDEQRAQWRQTMAENAEGWANRSKALHLHSGVTATELGKHDDSGFIIGPRREQVAEIARFWRVPLFMIGLEEKSTSWGTGIEQQVQGFITFTIRSWAKRWQEAMSVALLDDSEQEEYFFEFSFSDLVIGDLLQRMQAYQISRGLGMYTPNDLLRKENEPIRTDPAGDEYQNTPPGAPPNALGRPGQPGNGNGTGGSQQPPDQPPEDQQARRIPVPLLLDAVHRIANREIDDVARRAEKAERSVGSDPSIFEAWLTKYYAGDHREYVEKVLKPLAEAYGFEAWVVEQVAERLERTVEGLTPQAARTWSERRRAEVEQIVRETFQAGAAVGSVSSNRAVLEIVAEQGRQVNAVLQAVRESTEQRRLPVPPADPPAPDPVVATLREALAEQGRHVVNLVTALTASLARPPQPIEVHPAAAAVTVAPSTAAVTVSPTPVEVHVPPAAPAPVQVNVEAPAVSVEVAAPAVTVETPDVTVINHVPARSSTREIKITDRDGNVLRRGTIEDGETET